MSFALPDLTPLTWLLIAAGVFIVALLVPKVTPLDSRFGGRLMFVMFVASGLCAVIAAMRWAQVIP